jgi:hypothetical protein
MAEGFGDMNTVGTTRDLKSSADGGNSGRGPIDNVLPTGNIARGNEVRSSDGMDSGARRGMGMARGSKGRGMSDRR